MTRNCGYCLQTYEVGNAPDHGVDVCVDKSNPLLKVTALALDAVQDKVITTDWWMDLMEEYADDTIPDHQALVVAEWQTERDMDRVNAMEVEAERQIIAGLIKRLAFVYELQLDPPLPQTT